MFLYCNQEKHKEQTTANLISSLVHQLVLRRPVISEEIRNAFSYHNGRKTRPSAEDWLRLLDAEIKEISRAFVIIDALDEFYEAEAGKNSLLRMLGSLKSSVKLLITSRHILSNEYGIEPDYLIEIRASDEDIKKYVETQIADNSQLAGHVKKDPNMKVLMAKNVAENAQGMCVCPSKTDE